MKSYVAFLDNLRHLSVFDGQPTHAEKVASALDGQASQQLRNLVSLRQLRKQGAFFTSSDKAERLLELLPPDAITRGLIVDPQCGAGNLLLSAARFLPLHRTPERTLAEWGRRLGGLDIDPEFVQATKLRLWLLATQRCRAKARALPDLDKTLPLIRVGNSLSDETLQPNADVLLLNPPYGLRRVTNHCTWSRGKASAASIFIEDTIQKAKPGAVVGAILPDVLRSGTRYDLWRSSIAQMVQINRMELHDIFDRSTDINVFLTSMQKTVRRPVSIVPWSVPTTSSTSPLIGDFFDVKVGPLVPFRHSNVGPWHPYFTMSDMKPWRSITKLDARRRFAGRTYSGPFVAVRRVSRPDDKFRAIATIIQIKRPVAVENHIIICQPHDGTLKSCRQLLQSLQLPATNKWLNLAIRCRHLTTKSIISMPLFAQ